MTASTITDPRQKALVQVLGAIAYGEWKAHEGAKAEAEEVDDPDERRQLRTIAAEEMRHHKGFVRRLEALGADPERAMRPYREVLDRYHADEPGDEIEDAVRGYLGEGIADDLLTWLKGVVDPDTCEFVESVIADEEGHEARATARLRQLIADTPGGRWRAGAAARSMLVRMLLTGRHGAAPLTAFLRLGRGPDLLGALISGYVRRMRAIGLAPLGMPLPGFLTPSARLSGSDRRAS